VSKCVCVLVRASCSACCSVCSSESASESEEVCVLLRMCCCALQRVLQSLVQCVRVWALE